MAKVIISLPDALLAKVDKYCQDENYNRSECVRTALRRLIGIKLAPENDKVSK